MFSRLGASSLLMQHCWHGSKWQGQGHGAERVSQGVLAMQMGFVGYQLVGKTESNACD
jgi:hypothetical protein